MVLPSRAVLTFKYDILFIYIQTTTSFLDTLEPRLNEELIVSGYMATRPENLWDKINNLMGKILLFIFCTHECDIFCVLVLASVCIGRGCGC